MARTKAEKRRSARAKHRQDGSLAPVPKRLKRGKARMAEIKAAAPPDDDLTLITRAAKAGKAVPAGRDARAALLREMRALWMGCRAGMAMASVVRDDADRQRLWDVICDMRRVWAAYDRSIWAPARHARGASLPMLPDRLDASAASPPADLRSEDERAVQARMAMAAMQARLRLCGAAAGVAVAVVIDDAPCRHPQALVRVLRMIGGQQSVDNGR